VFDALRKIGAAKGADKVKSLWQAGSTKKGAPPGPDLMTRILAVGAYPFLVRDNSGASDLAEIAADNKADDNLRTEAATAFARLSNNPDDIKVLNKLADRYFDESAKKKKEAAGKPKTDADAADKELEKVKVKVDEAKMAVLKATKDTTKTAADIKAASETAKKLEEDYKEAKKVHKGKVAAFKQAEAASKAYKGYARMFQTHISRISVGIRCKGDINCFAATLKQTPEQAAKNSAQWIKDIKDWTKDEQLGLLEGEVERAMLEIGKAGPKAAALTDTLLDAAKSDNRLIRQSILLALPKVAKVPCANCEAKLDAAIKAGEGKTTLGDLNLETTMLRNYFAWAGGKTPSTAAPAEAPAAPAAPAKE
jgi:hypothetical protein